MILFEEQNTDAVSPIFYPNGGKAVVIVRAETFSGMTVEIQMDSVNSGLVTAFIPLVNGTFTSVGQVTLDYLPSGTAIRAQCSNTPSNANLFVEILQ